MDMTLGYEPSAIAQVASEIVRILLVLNVLGVFAATAYLLVVQRLSQRVRFAMPPLVVTVFVGVHACIALLMLAVVVLFLTYEDSVSVFASLGSACLAILGLLLWRRILARDTLLPQTPGSLGLSNEEHGGV